MCIEFWTIFLIIHTFTTAYKTVRVCVFIIISKGSKYGSTARASTQYYSALQYQIQHVYCLAATVDNWSLCKGVNK